MVTNHQPTGRLFILDLLKAMSIIAVVSYHSIFVPRSTYATNTLLLDPLFAPLRFCVPVLLTISFLLFERGLTNHSSGPVWLLIKKRLIRLAIPTLFWFSLAAGLKLLKGSSSADLIGEVLKGEIFTGAYYLLIMFQLIPLYIWSRRWLTDLRNVLVIILIQGFVFLFIYASLSSLHGTQVISILRSIDRPLIIYWFVYVVIGAYFYKKLPIIVRISDRISLQLKALFLLLTSLSMAAEYSYLAFLSEGSVPPFDYAMFSCVLSVAVAFLCFASVDEKQLLLPLRRGVMLLSKYSLGVFCINGIVSQIFLSFGSHWFSEATFGFLEILAMKLIGWVILLTVSLGLSVLLDKAGLKNIVC